MIDTINIEEPDWLRHMQNEYLNPGGRFVSDKKMRRKKIEYNGYKDIRVPGFGHSFETYLRAADCALRGKIKSGSKAMEECN